MWTEGNTPNFLFRPLNKIICENDHEYPPKSFRVLQWQHVGRDLRWSSGWNRLICSRGLGGTEGGAGRSEDRRVKYCWKRPTRDLGSLECDWLTLFAGVETERKPSSLLMCCKKLWNVMRVNVSQRINPMMCRWKLLIYTNKNENSTQESHTAHLLPDSVIIWYYDSYDHNDCRWGR